MKTPQEYLLGYINDIEVYSDNTRQQLFRTDLDTDTLWSYSVTTADVGGLPKCAAWMELVYQFGDLAFITDDGRLKSIWQVMAERPLPDENYNTIINAMVEVFVKADPTASRPFLTKNSEVKLGECEFGSGSSELTITFSVDGPSYYNINHPLYTVGVEPIVASYGCLPTATTLLTSCDALGDVSPKTIEQELDNDNGLDGAICDAAKVVITYLEAINELDDRKRIEALTLRHVSKHLGLASSIIDYYLTVCCH